MNYYKDKNIFLVGTNFGSDGDVLEEFLNKNIWKIGWEGLEHEQSYLKTKKIFDNINVGDYLIAKSSYTKKSGLPFGNPKGTFVSVNSIRAVGIVTEFIGDGHTLKVNWKKDWSETPREWYFYTGRPTIWQLNKADPKATQLIDFIFHDTPQDYQNFMPTGFENETKTAFPSQEDIADFKRYLETFLAVCKKSIGNYHQSDKGYEMKNYVVGGKKRPIILSDGITEVRRRFAQGDNDLNRFPYLNIKNVNLFYDWGRNLFNQPVLFTVVRNKAIALKQDLETEFVINQFAHKSFDDAYQLDENQLQLKNEEEYGIILNRTLDLVAVQKTSDKTNDLSSYSKDLLQSKNIIFRGPPGTGKTYLAKEIASEILGVSVPELAQSEQFGFVQFHPSYDYTDFVEGLRPLNDQETGQIGFELMPGVFKQFVEKAQAAQYTGGHDNFDEAWEKFFQAVTEVQTDNPEKTYQLSTLTGKPMRLQAYVSRGMEGVWEYGKRGNYYNKAQCYLVYQEKKGVPQGGLDNYRKAIIQHLKEHYGLLDFVAKKPDVINKPYVFVIDEINRGEISKIFGELFFSLDPGYRGKKGGVATQYQSLHETDELFYIPDNVYLIGTMNDIDRSIDTFDFAMRRRFRFIEIKADDPKQLQMLNDLPDAEQAILRLRSLNQEICNTEQLNNNYQIGPSYFLKLAEIENDYDTLWSDYLEPLLTEYVRGFLEEQELLENFRQAYEEPVLTGDELE